MLDLERKGTRGPAVDNDGSLMLVRDGTGTALGPVFNSVIGCPSDERIWIDCRVISGSFNS